MSLVQDIRRALAHLVAGPELDELERWHVRANEAEKWMAGEFSEAVEAVRWVRQSASGRSVPDISRLREWLRNKRQIRQPTVVIAGPYALNWAEAPAWSSAAVADNFGNLFWASDYADGARFESVQGRVGGIIAMEPGHAWKLIARRPHSA